MIKSFKRGYFIAALLVLVPANAMAQQTQEAVPDASAIKAVDENGVDLIGGGIHFPALDQSIGTPESGMHVFLESYSILTPDNYSGTLEFQTPGPSPYGGNSDHMEVKYGSRIDRFTLANGVGVSYKGGMGSFSCSGNFCTYTDPQGAILEFDGWPNSAARTARATRLIKPDGEIITFTYTNGRTVSSSLGWMIKGYQMINSAADYCDPAAANCDALTSYPKFSRYTDVMGNQWSFSNIGSETTPEGRTTSVLKAIDPRGVETVWTQHPAADPAAGNVQALYSNRVGRVTRAGQTWTYTPSYTQFPCCDWTAPLHPWRVLVNPPGGSIQMLTFSPNDSQATLYVDGGRSTSQTYLNYQVNSITVPGGVSTSYVRDSRQNILSTTVRPTNGASNGSEDIVVSTAAYPATCTNVKTCNKPTSVTDARGNTTAYTYDPNHGGMLTETKPAVNGVQAQTRYEYQQFTPYLKTSTGDTLAQPPVWRLVATRSCQTMPLGTCAGTTDELKTTIAYDPSSSAYGARNLLPLSKTVSRGDGSLATTVTFTYDRYGNVIVEDGPRAGTDDAVYSFYDLKRRKTGTIGGDPDGAGTLPRAAVRTVYGPDGKVESVAKGTVTQTTLAALQAMVPSQRVDTEYSSLTGLAVAERHYDGGTSPTSVRQMSYDVRSRLECVALRMNPAAFGSLPASACTLGPEGTNGPDRITRNVYDHMGQLVQLREGVGTSIEVAEATYSYTAAGKKDYVIDANGNRARFVYDRFDRLSQWIFPSTTRPTSFDYSTPDNALATAGALNSADYELYAYDANGNRTSLRKRDGSTLTYSYDALNRNTVKVVPERAGLAATHTRDVYYGYDLRGLQTYARFDSASGEGITTVYDGLGRMESSTISMDGVTRSLSYQHDNNGNRTRVTYPDGNYFAFGYDGLDRMTAIGRDAPSGLAIYGYNDRGLRSSLGSGSWTYYGYDPVGRLNALTQDIASTTYDVTYGFGYNPASQMTTRSTSNDAFAYAGDVNVNRAYAVNGLNQYTSAGPASFTHDANGNLTGDGGSTYVYDVENRLVSASGTTTASMRYDPLGRLYETSGGSAGTTRFLYDGDELVAEYDGSGNMLRRYVHGSGNDDPLAWFEGPSPHDSVAKLIKTNHQGSVVALTDWNGNLANINSYDEWGVPSGMVPGTVPNIGRFQYTGQAWIPELKMYYYKARIYSPTLGRFMQTDPIGYDDQVNLYAYVGNDPVNNTDPDGQQTVPAPIYDGLDRATAACGGDPDCGLREWNRIQGGVAQNVAVTAGGEAVVAAGGFLMRGGVMAGAGWLGRALGITRAGERPMAVLGHYPAYTKLASEIGARVFSVPAKVWERMTPAQQWLANTKFLDRQIAQGATFKLATPANEARAGSAFAKEIKYLLDRGYELSKDGMRICHGTARCP